MVNRTDNHSLLRLSLVDALKLVRVSVPVVVVELVLSHALVAGICLNLGRASVELPVQSISLEKIGNDTTRLYERWKNERSHHIQATGR